MYVLYTTQSRLRISAPFYLILWNADHAIPFAYLCAILFNFHKMPFRNPTARIYIILFNFMERRPCNPVCVSLRHSI